VPDEELERLIPVRVAIVEITLTDGTQLSERVEHVRGTPENPMTPDEVVAKARELMASVLGDKVCSKLIDRVLGLDDVKDIRELRALLRAAERSGTVSSLAQNVCGSSELSLCSITQSKRVNHPIEDWQAMPSAGRGARSLLFFVAVCSMGIRACGQSASPGNPAAKTHWAMPATASTSTTDAT